MTDKAPEGVAVTQAKHIETLQWLAGQYLPGGPRDVKGAIRAAVAALSTPDTPSAGYLHADNPCVNEPALCDRCNGGPCDSLPPATGNSAGEPVAKCPCCRAPCTVETEPAQNITLEDENGDYYTEHRLGTKTYRYAHPPAPTNQDQEPPSARITDDKDRENPVEGVHLSQDREEVIEAMARAMYQCEKERSDKVDAMFAEMKKSQVKFRMEHWDDVADLYRADARHALAAALPLLSQQGDREIAEWLRKGAGERLPGEMVFAWDHDRMLADAIERGDHRP